MPQHKIFSEEEATNVLKQAALLHERANSGASDYVPGITAAELERMAREMGIQPEFLRQAIEESTKSAPAPRRGWKTGKEFDHVFDGCLSPDRYDVISSTVSVGFNSNNNTGLRQIGRSVHGSVMAGPSILKLEVTNRGGRTRLKASSSPLLGYILGGELALFGSIISLVSVADSGNVPRAVAGLVVSLAGGFGLFKFFQNWGNRAAEATVEKLCTAIEEELEDQAKAESATQDTDAGSPD